MLLILFSKSPKAYIFYFSTNAKPRACANVILNKLNCQNQMPTNLYQLIQEFCQKFANLKLFVGLCVNISEYAHKKI